MSNKLDDMYREIGSQIKKVRKNKSMTMNELAQKVDLSQSAISMIENGVRQPSLSTLSKFSEVLNYDFTKFLTSQSESFGSMEGSDLKVKSLDFELIMALKSFNSEISDPDINSAAQQTLINYVNELLNRDEVKEEIDLILKRTIKETLDKKQNELNKLYKQIGD